MHIKAGCDFSFPFPFFSILIPFLYRLFLLFCLKIISSFLFFIYYLSIFPLRLYVQFLYPYLHFLNYELHSALWHSTRLAVLCAVINGRLWWSSWHNVIRRHVSSTGGFICSLWLERLGAWQCFPCLSKTLGSLGGRSASKPSWDFFITDSSYVRC